MSKPPAPTDRLGDDRRRSPFVAAAALIVALGLAACGGGGPWSAERSPVPAALLGQVVSAHGPDIECRGLARDRCVRAGAIEGEVAGVSIAEVERVIVSCEGAPCTSTGGAIRIDLLLRDGTTVEVGRGGYGEFRQP